MASEERSDYDRASDNVLRSLAAMGKLLRRGTTPPLHPDAEWALLESVGLGGRLDRSPLEGDVSPTLRRPPRVRQEVFTVPASEDLSIDTGATESTAERQLLDWIAERHPEMARWLIPQASFDRMLQAAGRDAAGGQRCDFLWAPPGADPLVIEVDGGQHENQESVDKERDRLLEEVGIPTIRVQTEELKRSRGPNLSAISRALGDGEPRLELGFDRIPDDSAELSPDAQGRLVWGAIQVHRLMLGLCEAAHRGFLADDHWTVEVEDPTSTAVELVGPYLATLHALDHLWGSGTLVPENVLFTTGGKPILFHRDGEKLNEHLDGEEEPDPDQRTLTYERRDFGNGDEVPEVDVRILLQCDRTPVQPLPGTGRIPTVVIRSTGIGILLSDPPMHRDGRWTPRPLREALTVILRAVFAKQDFREGQYEAINEIMHGEDCAVLLPTGAGKSLVYQLGGLCIPGVALVVDPLVALAEDQVRGMRRHGIDRAMKIAGPLDQAEVERRLRSVAEANTYFVLVTPERFQSQRFRVALAALTAKTSVNVAVVDEAHCVSEWGHDFRPAYLNLGRVIREYCKDPPLLALTGTASRPVLRDVLVQLDIEEGRPHTIVTPRHFDRRELNFSVVSATQGPVHDDEAHLLAALTGLAKKFDKPLGRLYEPDDGQTFSGLIFCPTKGAKGWHNVSSTTDLVQGTIPSVRSYASGMTAPGDRFMDNSVVALATTNAFAMGIDKPNIRWVVHYMLPRSIEAYYQEVGRAGRDGQRAECVLIVTDFDTNRNRRLLAPDLDLEEVRRGAKGHVDERDDVRQALWFLLQAFPGIETEVRLLVSVAHELEPKPERATQKIPGDKDPKDKSREKALHRLAVLGVVDDYLKGAGSFTVTVNGIAPDEIAQRLEEFVERHDPGTGRTVRDRIAIDAGDDLLDTIEACGRELVECVYRNVERSRRRSLREMWLLAHDSAKAQPQDQNQKIRDGIMGYLTEGFLSNEMVDLAERPVFRYADWIELWDSVTSNGDVLELLFAAVRLLASYPSSPGLLAARAVPEALVHDGARREGDPREFESNLRASLRSALTGAYQADPEDIAEFVEWGHDMIGDRRPGWLAGLVGVYHEAGVLPELLNERVAAQSAVDWRLAPFPLADGIESARDLALSTLSAYTKG